MLKKISSVKDVVATLGGVAATCAVTGADEKSVYHWTGRAKMFPARKYRQIQDALKKKKARADDALFNMDGTQKKKAA
jgi:hypothetical protein